MRKTKLVLRGFFILKHLHVTFLHFLNTLFYDSRELFEVIASFFMRRSVRGSF